MLDLGFDFTNLHAFNIGLPKDVVHYDADGNELPRLEKYQGLDAVGFVFEEPHSSVKKNRYKKLNKMGALSLERIKKHVQCVHFVFPDLENGQSCTARSLAFAHYQCFYSELLEFLNAHSDVCIRIYESDRNYLNTFLRVTNNCLDAR